MMRQYDLIERVKRYNPNTSEALLNRAYVYAMKAHGEQKRASGDPYFSHPLEVAAILTDLKTPAIPYVIPYLHPDPEKLIGTSTVEDVQLAVLETDGSISIVPTSAQTYRSHRPRARAIRKKS